MRGRVQGMSAGKQIPHGTHACTVSRAPPLIQPERSSARAATMVPAPQVASLPKLAHSQCLSAHSHHNPSITQVGYSTPHQQAQARKGRKHTAHATHLIVLSSCRPKSCAASSAHSCSCCSTSCFSPSRSARPCGAASTDPGWWQAGRQAGRQGKSKRVHCTAHHGSTCTPCVVRCALWQYRSTTWYHAVPCNTHLVVGGGDEVLVRHPGHVHSGLQQLLKLAQPLSLMCLAQGGSKPAQHSVHGSGTTVTVSHRPRTQAALYVHGACPCRCEPYRAVACSRSCPRCCYPCRRDTKQAPAPPPHLSASS